MSIVLVAAGCASAAPDREEAQSDLQEEAVQEKSTEGTTEESPQETGQNPPAEEFVDEWNEFIVNRKESYILKDGKWLDLTSKAAYDVILGSEKKYVGDADIYDNLPIKAYLTISSEELGTRVVGVTVE